MFNDLISKFEIRDSILILIPHEVVDDELLILISHGSGGPGEAETAMSNLATIIQMNAALTPQHVVLLTLDTTQ